MQTTATDKLPERDTDKGGEGANNSDNFVDFINGSPPPYVFGNDSSAPRRTLSAQFIFCPPYSEWSINRCVISEHLP